MKRILQRLASATTMAFSLALAQPALAQGMDHSKMAGKPGASAPELTEGEIRKVDKINKGLIIKHGDIKNLQMPGMTMSFRVKQPQMLDGLKDGDKIRFRAEQVGADLVVTEIHVSKP